MHRPPYGYSDLIVTIIGLAVIIGIHIPYIIRYLRERRAGR